MVAPAPGDIEQSANGAGNTAGVLATDVAVGGTDRAGEAAAGVGLSVMLVAEGLPETVTALRLGLYPAIANIVAATTMKTAAVMARPVGPCHRNQRGQLGLSFIRGLNGTESRSFRLPPKGSLEGSRLTTRSITRSRSGTSRSPSPRLRTISPPPTRGEGKVGAKETEASSN